MDHHQFDEEILEKGTAAIKKTRDGKLRAAVPHPIGKCIFLNDVDAKEMNAALRRHKMIMREYPRNGEGLEAYVDASDTGYTESNITETVATQIAAEKAGEMNGMADKKANGVSNGMNGHATNGVNGHETDGVNGHATNGVNGHQANGHETNGVNGSHEKAIANGSAHVNGATNGIAKGASAQNGHVDTLHA